MEGQNIAIDARWAEGKYNRLPNDSNGGDFLLCHQASVNFDTSDRQQLQRPTLAR